MENLKGFCKQTQNTMCRFERGQFTSVFVVRPIVRRPNEVLVFNEDEMLGRANGFDVGHLDADIYCYALSPHKMLQSPINPSFQLHYKLGVLLVPVRALGHLPSIYLHIRAISCILFS